MLYGEGLHSLLLQEDPNAGPNNSIINEYLPNILISIYGVKLVVCYLLCWGHSGFKFATALLLIFKYPISTGQPLLQARLYQVGGNYYNY